MDPRGGGVGGVGVGVGVGDGGGGGSDDDGDAGGAMANTGASRTAVLRDMGAVFAGTVRPHAR